MYLNSTPCTYGFNRQVHIRNKNSYVTNYIGLFKAFGKLFKNPISERWGKQICLN